MRNLKTLAVLWMGLLIASAQAADADLTIMVDGDMAVYGGVVTVYPIPSSDVSTEPMTVTVTERYSEIQFKFLKDNSYNYRIVPVEGVEASGLSQTLSVIGVDGQARGPSMKRGFREEFSDGGRVIRILPAAESPDAPYPNWGETQGYDAKPPADLRSSRVVRFLFDGGPNSFGLQCGGTDRVQVCAPRSEDDLAIEARWWRAVAEQRLERLRHHALRKCYDNRSALATGNCQPVKGSDEPEYE